MFAQLRGHEEVVFFNEPRVGLRAIVALYSTALGPGLGGTRFRPYASEAEALEDVLDLSQAMAYKNAVAGLDLGGGKAVIIGDPNRDKTDELLRAYGRCLQTLGGRYYTACDVGTYVQDMDVIGEVCDYVTGRSTTSGDSSILTAVGVFASLRAAAQHVWGEPTLRGRRVGISGAGKVGARLAAHLLEDGAGVVIGDVSSDAVARLRAAHPEVEVAAPGELETLALDVYSPCALGGALNVDVVAALRARIVCGAANNQLASPDAAVRMAERGILYVPDFVANAGGIIQVGAEVCGYDADEAQRKAEAIFDTTLSVLDDAARTGELPEAIAERRAEARISSAA